MMRPHALTGGLSLTAVGFEVGGVVLTQCASGLGFPTRVSLKPLHECADPVYAAGQVQPDLILFNAECVASPALLRTLSRLRAGLPSVPLLVLGAHQTLRLAALACGADLCSPGRLAPRELRAIVRLLLERDATAGHGGEADAAAGAAMPAESAATSAPALPVPAIGDLSCVPTGAPRSAPRGAPTWSLDPVCGALVTPVGEPIWLTANEVRLLQAMLQAEHGELTAQAWVRARGQAVPADAPDRLTVRDLPVAISRLKAKVARQSPFELPVRAVRGTGYQFMDALYLTSLLVPGETWQYDAQQRALRAPSGRSLRLSRRESALLLGFLASERRVITNTAWTTVQPARRRSRDVAEPVDARNLAVVVSRFKTKLLQTLGEPVPVCSIHGLGYQFVGRLEQASLLMQRPAVG